VSSAARRMRSSATVTPLMIVYDAYTIDEHLTYFRFFLMFIG
jgi:hypothetical protein